MRAKLSLDSSELISLLSGLVESGLISNIKPVEITPNSPLKNKEGIAAAEGEIHVENQAVLVQICLDAWFPHSLPLLYLVPWNALGFIPHVDKNGFICYAQTEGLLLNRHDPRGILESSIKKTISVLRSGVRGENRWDFVDEFEAYWINLDGVKVIPSTVSPHEYIREVIAGKRENNPKEKNDYEYLCDNATSIQQFYNGSDNKQCTHRTALYIPLKSGTFIQPPLPNTHLGGDFFRSIVSGNLTPKEIKRLNKLTRKPKREEVVIFRLPRPSGGGVIFGAIFEGISKFHPLLPGGTVEKITPIATLRHDKAYLLPRGGANTSLQENRVAIIGCGSVGGFLTYELIRSGVLDFTLIDNDTLTAENAFRHVLGKTYWGKSKVEAMKEDIQRGFPYVNVSTIKMTAQNSFSTGLIYPGRFNLIITAIGNDTINLFLNEYFHSQKGSPPIIYTWLEPYGIGGQALVTGNGSNEGCLECLYTPMPDDDSPVLGNRASFAEPNQFFSKDISGCANRFTPYGSQDATRTAGLAARLAIQVLLGQLHDNPLVSWKGDASDFLRAGYKLSPRYKLNEKQLEETQYKYKNPKCPICGQFRYP